MFMTLCQDLGAEPIVKALVWGMGSLGLGSRDKGVRDHWGPARPAVREEGEAMGCVERSQGGWDPGMG